MNDKQLDELYKLDQLYNTADSAESFNELRSALLDLILTIKEQNSKIRKLESKIEMQKYLIEGSERRLPKTRIMGNGGNK